MSCAITKHAHRHVFQFEVRTPDSVIVNLHAIVPFLQIKQFFYLQTKKSGSNVKGYINLNI